MAEEKAQEPARGPQVTERIVERTVKEGPTGENAKTEPENPAEHFFLAADGKTKINAFGEEKGSKEDKQRMAGLGLAEA